MRGHVILGSFFILTSGCTNVLGIDGDYVLDADASGSNTAGGVGGGEQGGSGTGGQSDTPEASAGGASGTGGEPAFDASVPPPDAEVVDPSCRPGLYVGSVTGTHALSVTVVGAPISVSGSVSFRLSGEGDALTLVQGQLDGQLSAVTIMYGTLSAALEGTYDCTSRQLDAVLVGGNIEALPLLLPIEGTLDGDFNGTSFSGQWQIRETQQPSAQGRGTWSATWMSP